MTATRPTIDADVFTSSEYAANPYPTLKLLRDHYPVYQNPRSGMWMITRYDDVVACFRDSDRFSASPNGLTIGAVFGPTLMEYDGDEHTKLRNIVAPEFVGLKLKALMPVIVRNTMALIEKFTTSQAERIARSAASVGEIDIVDDFATRLPLNVILDVLDLPQEAHEMFHTWYPAMMNGINGSPEHRALGVAANQAYHDYLDPLIERRARNPGADLLSRLSVAEVDGHRMTKDEIKSFASLLLVAGAETTDKAIANLWYQLLANPAQWQAVQRDPELLEPAFSEMMRVHPPASGQMRRTIVDVTLHDVTIPAGSFVNLSIYGANRDERVFSNPDQFDIFRDDLNMGRELRSGFQKDGRSGHLGFGLGKHFCAGYQLARAETVVGTRELMKVIRNPRFKPGSKPTPIAIRLQPWSLPLEFDAA
ncbi:MAG: cytochrome P450 [Pseudomonadales bacterium]|nr:cytochrome P450 [Pseudomonadales bacterium]MCP5183345.1 cytochrome P450 [Pseudomonadales bacterium]